MIKKKLFAVLIYMLTCFAVLSACASTTKEETEQSSEKKAKKKDKKKKDKKKETEEDSKESEKETDAKGLDSEREMIKNQIVEAMDSFLDSKEFTIFISIEGSSSKVNLTESRLDMEGSTLYYVTMQDMDSEQVRVFVTDGEIEYVQEDSNDSSSWNKNVDYEKYTEQLIISANYISYMKFIYAALDAGFDYYYSSDDNVYIIEADRDKVAGLDLKAIDEKLNNADKLAQYKNNYSTTRELILKAYPEKDGIVQKKYKFFISDNVFEITETIYDATGSEIMKTDAVNLKITSALQDNKDSIIALFNQLKSNDKGE